MPGTYQYDVEIKSNVAKLLSDMKQVQDRLDTVEGKEYKIKLNVDEKKLSNVISNLEKMLDSLGKGTGDFKQFENLSKELSSVVLEVQNLSKAFGKVDDSGTKTLLSSIQNIDKSLSELSQNILNVNKNMSNMGGNTSGAVKQVENITNAYQDAAKEAEKLVDAQSKIEQKTNISSGLDSNISKYQEIVSLVKEYYELSQKIQTPKLSYQKRSEDYDKIDAYLLSKKSSHNIVAGQIKSKYDREKSINDTYHDMSKGINEGKDFAVKAMKSAIQSYWSNVTEMPSDDKLLSSRKIDRSYKGSSKEEYIIPKKYQDMEKSVIQESIAMNKNNIAYEEERKQIEANNSALKERMNLIRNTIKGYDKNPDYNGEYRMGLSLKSSDKGKTDIFSSTSSISQEEMLQEICNMLGVEIPKNADKAKEAIKEVASATDSTEQRKDAFPDKDVSASVETATNSIKEENNVLEQNTQKVKENTQAKEQNANANLNKYDKRLDSYNGKVDKYQATIDRFNDGGWTSDTYLEKVQAIKNAVHEYETLLNELKGKDASLVTSDDINRLDNYEKKIKDTIATVTNMSASEKGYNFVSGQKELDKIHKLLNENSKMSSEAKAKIKAYYAEIESGNPSMSLDKIHGEILKIYNAEVEAGRAGRTLWDTLKNSGFHQIAAQMAGMFGVYDVINVVKEGINTVRELDTAMTEVRKVSDATEAQYTSFRDTVSSTAKEIASTNKELLNSSADFLRLGYSLEQAEDLAKNATLFVNVGDGVDITEATEDMITAMKAFDIQAEDSIKIVDDYNQIGNKFALSATDIGEAMKRSASALETGNNSFEESIALITAMNEIVQNSENTGNTLKVFSLRLRGAKAELEDMGEDTEGLCESSSKLREQLQALTGVDIMLNDNTFKSTTQIVKELGATWDKLSDSSQAATLELIAGKTRANNVAALLKNYQQIDNVLESLGEAEGSALRENDAIVDSINGRIKILSATAEEFWQNFIDTDLVKELVSLTSDLLNILTKIVNIGNGAGTLGLIGAGTGIFKFIKNFDWVLKPYTKNSLQ